MLGQQKQSWLQYCGTGVTPLLLSVLVINMLSDKHSIQAQYRGHDPCTALGWWVKNDWKYYHSSAFWWNQNEVNWILYCNLVVKRGWMGMNWTPLKLVWRCNYSLITPSIYIFNIHGSIINSCLTPTEVWKQSLVLSVCFLTHITTIT